MFYDVFLQLCNSVNKSPSAVAQELGLNKSAVTNWKNRQTPPRDATLRKLADYFAVSVDYLLGNEKKSPEINSGDLLIADEDIIRIQRARNKMNDAERAHMMETLKVIYKNYFTDDFEDTDTEE